MYILISYRKGLGGGQRIWLTGTYDTCLKAHETMRDLYESRVNHLKHPFPEYEREPRNVQWERCYIDDLMAEVKEKDSDWHWVWGIVSTEVPDSITF